MNVSYPIQSALPGVTTLARQAYLSYKGQFLWLNWPAYVSNVFLRPGLIVALYSLTGYFARGPAAAEAYVIGLTAYAVPGIIFGGVLQSFYYERSWGTIAFFFASRGGRLDSYLTRGVLHLPNALFAVVAGVAFAAVFLHASYGAASWPAVAACYALMALSSTACALCVANLSIVLRDWQSLYSLVLTSFLIFPGVVIPRDDLPAGIGAIGDALPVTHALVALREAYAGASLGAVSGDLALEALVGVTYVVIGYGLFRAVEALARRGGSYDV
ncbi:MAG TPA: ABC transporter permease [Dehalococcoidia bacterium]|jgi:ABC-type polysaccharide/polyol phosphate export permease